MSNETERDGAPIPPEQDTELHRRIARELGIRPEQVAATARLLAEGATVPFIARYRKEATGTLDEVQIAAVRDALERAAELEKRRAAIIKSLRERDLFVDPLARAILAATDLTELEDLYLPHRPKRRTRATIARERGLEPLALALFDQSKGTDPAAEAARFVDPEREVPDVDAALAGARDVVAEWVSEDRDARQELRSELQREGQLGSRVVKKKEKEGAKFRDYFDWSEPVRRAPSHRILALLRGEREGVLSLTIRLDADRARTLLKRRFMRNRSRAAEQVALAVDDAYQRLLVPSLENEARGWLKERADQEAIAVFADNLRELLLAAPLGARRVLAIDPGFRTGCKVVSLDPQGALVGHTAIFPHGSDRQREQAAATVREWCERDAIEAIAIGNGTAGRETEAFIRSLDLGNEVTVIMVNESGASIYSASEVAREEFPDHDVTVRGSVSIGRRLMDPLAELVKLDPKSIGVGQYQHDVEPRSLRRALDDVVVGCVNRVGVDVNSASPQLLTYVAGLGPQLARNIVAYRDENGSFATRAQLKKVPRLGAKAFEQCAGFLRIRDGRQPLDGSAVHPERYPIVEAMAKDLSTSVPELLANGGLQERIDVDRYVDADVGRPTLEDIVDELAKPGRDPRAKFEVFSFAEGIEKPQDLRPGMRLPGIVTNVTAFGAFVDVGVHQDGLVHISQLADRFVSDPSEVVRVQQHVQVTVLEVDLERNRIGLSMRAQGGSR